MNPRTGTSDALKKCRMHVDDPPCDGSLTTFERLRRLEYRGDSRPDFVSGDDGPGNVTQPADANDMPRKPRRNDDV